MSSELGKAGPHGGLRRHGRAPQALAGGAAGRARRAAAQPQPAQRPAELAPVLGTLALGTPVAFEAACGWGWLADLLDELGLEPHLVHPTRCKAIASARLKDDRVDARTLAHLLRADLLSEAWIAPPQVRDQRALLRHRAALVRTGTALKNRIHDPRVQALLALPGIGRITAMTLVAEIGDTADQLTEQPGPNSNVMRTLPVGRPEWVLARPLRCVTVPGLLAP